MTRSSKKKSKKPSKANKNNLKENNTYPPLLIEKHKEDIIKAVKENKVLIIIGQTGCGKSTQVPQYLHNHRKYIGLRDKDQIACLHPRSVAATTLAERVAYECNSKVGKLVGYKVRFYTLCDREARIVYMTAGFMTRLLSNPTEINAYGVIIIDEAHQRSVDNDVVMGQLKKIMAKDDRVRLVIMSATLNTLEMRTYYPEAFVINIQTAVNNTVILYKTVKGNDYVKAVEKVVLEILSSSQQGHILIFLPSEEKVWKCKGKLKEKVQKSIKVLPFYGAMDHSDKMKVFMDYKNSRKIIVATNIAETSLTIEGVQFVIDTGFVKRVHYDHVNRVERWITERVSAAEAEQRKGRAGRTSGDRSECYRLYDRYDYHKELSETLAPFLNALDRKYSLAQLRLVAENLETIQNVSNLSEVCESIEQILMINPTKKEWISLRYPLPDISMVNLDSTVLIMKQRKIDITKFPFIVAPDPNNIKTSISNLKDLSLLEDNGYITRLGTRVANLPLSPSFGKVAVLASNLPCREDVFIIIAMLSRPVLVKLKKLSNYSHHYLNDPEGDLIKLFHVFEEAEKNRFSKSWCKEFGVIFSNLNYCKLIYAQLCTLLKTPFSQSPRLYPYHIRLGNLKEVFLSGFFQNLSVKMNDNYLIYDGKSGVIHLNSCVNHEEPYILSMCLQSSLGAKNILMKDCMAYNKAILIAINPRLWKIRSNLWMNVLKGVEIYER